MLLGRCALVFLAGCTLFEDDPEDCVVDASTELGVVFADQMGNIHEMTEMVEFPLISAPQGGHIALIAPRMKTDIVTCKLQISSALRDMTTNLVVGLEQRPVTLTRGSDGWAIPPDPAGLSDLANVAICPSSATTMISGRPFQVEVKVLGLTAAESPSTSVIAIPTVTAVSTARASARIASDTLAGCSSSTSNRRWWVRSSGSGVSRRSCRRFRRSRPAPRCRSTS